MKLRILALIATTTAAGLLACSHDEPAKDPSTTSSTMTTPSTTDTTATTATTGTTTPQRTSGTTGTTDPLDTAKKADANTTTATTNADANKTPQTTPPPAAPPPMTQGAATHPPDNTGVNDRDRGNTATPMTQGNSQSEVNITAAIRRSVMADGSLGFNAKNVKIITSGTRVVLRGPVANDHERTAIEAWAKQAAGVTAVDNQIEVKK
ncbi:hypothetical protein BH09MYX1_BH09MYX1_00330 [soil metagenome]